MNNIEYLRAYLRDTWEVEMTNLENLEKNIIDDIAEEVRNKVWEIVEQTNLFDNI
jgi:hypothetical protein